MKMIFGYDVSPCDVPRPCPLNTSILSYYRDGMGRRSQQHRSSELASILEFEQKTRKKNDIFSRTRRGLKRNFENASEKVLQKAGQFIPEEVQGLV